MYFDLEAPIVQPLTGKEPHYYIFMKPKYLKKVFNMTCMPRSYNVYHVTIFGSGVISCNIIVTKYIIVSITKAHHMHDRL